MYNRQNNTWTLLVEFGGVSNLELFLTQGVDREYPQEMVELSRLIELPELELTGADCSLLVRAIVLEYS